MIITCHLDVEYIQNPATKKSRGLLYRNVIRGGGVDFAHKFPSGAPLYILVHWSATKYVQEIQKLLFPPL
jgi:hypothetical protein